MTQAALLAFLKSTTCQRRNAPKKTPPRQHNSQLDLPLTRPIRLPRMNSRALRTLVFVCSLLVAMPPGACCLLAGMLARADTKAAATAKPVQRLCCRHGCKHKATSPSTPTDKCPAKSPDQCPCLIGLAVLPLTKAAEQVDLGCSVTVLLPVRMPSASPTRPVAGAAVSVVHPPTYPIHVIKCLWLC